MARRRPTKRTPPSQLRARAATWTPSSARPMETLRPSKLATSRTSAPAMLSASPGAERWAAARSRRSWTTLPTPVLKSRSFASSWFWIRMQSTALWGSRPGPQTRAAATTRRPKLCPSVSHLGPRWVAPQPSHRWTRHAGSLAQATMQSRPPGACPRSCGARAGMPSPSPLGPPPSADARCPPRGRSAGHRRRRACPAQEDAWRRTRMRYRRLPEPARAAARVRPLPRRGTAPAPRSRRRAPAAAAPRRGARRGLGPPARQRPGAEPRPRG
mmetsp:Transcript_167642/g.538429  ORF Transcript_167642/g.538429 Transcript_167642/m.538429 type:complete len:271 (+) Transcript_167642:682-1494(+)